MKETYNLVLNSQITTNRIGTLTRSYQYMVNWSSVLPKPHDITQKYSVRFSFITPSTTSFGEVFLLSIDFGGSNLCDQTNSRNNYLGYVFPVMNTSSSTSGTNTVFYHSRANATDNLPITIEYPNNNMIKISLINSNLSYPTNYFTNNYILNLEFTPL